MLIKQATVLLSVVLLSMPALAVDQPGNMQQMGMMYGNPQTMRGPQSGMYPAPPMNPQMMQQMMEAKKKQMDEMRSQQQAAAAAQQANAQQAAAAAKPKMPDVMPEACKNKHEMMSSMMERRSAMDGHLQNVEERLANIESLLKELITLIKTK